MAGEDVSDGKGDFTSGKLLFCNKKIPCQLFPQFFTNMHGYKHVYIYIEIVETCAKNMCMYMIINRHVTRESQMQELVFSSHKP